ncbi:MAG: hypothetical protein U5K81_00405 [Trueperaceae bacterium]|nr:hypothetical protein [Trueperaceae bacterium]
MQVFAPLVAVHRLARSAQVALVMLAVVLTACGGAGAGEDGGGAAPDPEGVEIMASGLEDAYAAGETVRGSISIRLIDPEHTVQSAVPFLNVVETQEPWPQAAHLIVSDGHAEPEIFQRVHDHEALSEGIGTDATLELKEDAPAGTYDLVVQVFVGTNTDPHRVNVNDRIALKAFRIEITD